MARKHDVYSRSVKQVAEMVEIVQREMVEIVLGSVKFLNSFSGLIRWGNGRQAGTQPSLRCVVLPTCTTYMYM